MCTDPFDQEAWKKVAKESALVKRKVLGYVPNFSSLPDVAYVNSKGHAMAWFRVEGKGTVSVDALLPGYLESVGNSPHEMRSGRIHMGAYDAYQIKIQIQREANFKGHEGYFVTTIPGREWAHLRKEYRLGMSGPYIKFEDPSKERLARTTIANLVKMPFASLIFKDGLGNMPTDWIDMSWEALDRSPGRVLVPGPRAILTLAYSEIYELHPYDVELQDRFVGEVNKAYDLARENLRDRTTLKVDYRLLVLKECALFARIHTSPDLPDPLPRYWYDPTEVSGGLDELMDLLAIEKTWTPGTDRYQLKVWFPAGTMFLVATAEAQLTTKGGGTEYVLVSPGSGSPWFKGATLLV